MVTIVSRPIPIAPSKDSRVLFTRLMEARPRYFDYARESLGLGDAETWRRVLSLMALSEKRGDSPIIGASSVLKQSDSKRSYRELREQVREGISPSYVLGIARDHAKRFYQKTKSLLERRVFGVHERSFLNGLTKKLKPDMVIFVDRQDTDKEKAITAREYYQWIMSNKPVGSEAKRILHAMSVGYSNQGPGIGPFNERRAGYVLSKLADAKLIKNFWICGEASSPLFVRDSGFEESELNKSFDYAMHEEAMAVDLIAHLNPEQGENYEYAAMQIKSSGSLGFKESKRFLSFDSIQKQEFEEIVPEAKDLFIEDSFHKNRYLLTVLRNVFHLPMNDRKIARFGPKDYSDDVANQMMATFEFMQNHNMTIKLDRPYQKLSYAQKVKVMIESGGLRLDHERVDAAYDNIDYHANQRKSS